MKKTILLAAVAAIAFTGCVSTSTPALYVKHGKTNRWYHIYQAKNCDPTEVKNYKTGALQCYNGSGQKTNVIYPVTQRQRNIDSQNTMAQVQMQNANINSLTNQLNNMSYNQTQNNIAMSNMGRPVYNIYGY